MTARTRTDELDVIETTVQKTYEWIKDLSALLGSSRQDAYQVLRGFLQTVRDRLTVDEAAHLSAQLPMLVRGFYYEGYDPSNVPIKWKAEEFVAVFAERAVIEIDENVDVALVAAAKVVRDHVTPGEMADVYGSLPESIRELFA
jgi:uncharacterized protein (DUF2267 family)